MNLNELIEAAADAWGEAPYNITIEVATKRVAIRSKYTTAPLFEKAVDEPGRFVNAEPTLRRAIALKLAERASKLNADVMRSRRNADNWEGQARAMAERAERLDPNYHQWVPTPAPQGGAA